MLVAWARDLGGDATASMRMVDERKPGNRPVGCTCGTKDWEGCEEPRPCRTCVASVNGVKVS